MRRRVHVGLGLLVLVGAGCAWVLLEERAERKAAGPGTELARDEVAQPVHLAGRPSPEPAPAAAPPTSDGAAPAPAPESFVVRGRIVSEDLGYIPTKRAWLIPKGVAGIRSWRKVKARAEVDDDGSFSLEGDPRGCWIGGLAAGHRPTFLDGDLWQGEEVELRLLRGRLIEVSVGVHTDGVQPELRVFVNSLQEAVYDFPGPDGEPDVSTHGRLAGGGRHSVYVSTNGRVRVHVGAEGFVTTPEHVDLGPEEEGASFDVTLGCRVRVEALDEETALPLSESIDLIARSVEGGPDHDVYRDPDDFAEAMEWSGLLPGAYRIAVTSDDYVDWESDVVRLSRPGEQASVEARLQPEPGRGRLLLKVAPPAGGSLEGAELSVLLGRPGDEGRLVWARFPVHAASPDRRRFLLPPIPPGDVHLLAWTGRVAVGRLAAYPVIADTTHEVDLPLEPGTLVRLLPPPRTQDVWSPGTALVLLEAPDGTRLPTAWFGSRLPPTPADRSWLMSSHEFRDERVSFEDMPRDDAVLGPYPFPTLSVQGHPSELVPNEN